MAMSAAGSSPEPASTKSYPLFRETETVVAIRTSNDIPIVPRIDCIFLEGVICTTEAWEGWWTVRGCENISAKCSYTFYPSMEPDPFVIEYCEHADNQAVRRHVHAIALVLRAEKAGSKHLGLYHLRRRKGRQAWLSVQVEALSPCADGNVLQRSSALGLEKQTCSMAVDTAATAKTTHIFESMHLRDRRRSSKRRAYQQYIYFVVEMYADVRTDGGEAS